MQGIIMDLLILYLTLLGMSCVTCLCGTLAVIVKGGRLPDVGAQRASAAIVLVLTGYVLCFVAWVLVVFGPRAPSRDAILAVPARILLATTYLLIISSGVLNAVSGLRGEPRLKGLIASGLQLGILVGPPILLLVGAAFLM